MAISRLVDRGNEIIEIYTTHEVEDMDGNIVKVPHGEPKKYRCTVAEDRQMDAELAGQITNKVLRVVVRDVPELDSWAEVRFRGEVWDLASPPHFSNGVSRAVKHVEFMLRSRSNIPTDVRGGD